MFGKVKIVLIHLMQHILFWVVSFFVLLQLMDQDGEKTIIDVIYTGLFHVHLIVFVGTLYYLLIPRHLSKAQYVPFALTSIGLFGLGFFMYQFTYNSISDWLFPDFYFVAVYEPIETLGILLIYYVVAILLYLSRSWFDSIELQKEVAELKELSSSNELKMLQAQISPHFLFNSLNTIYGLSIKKAPETPESIISLSQILRYNLEQDNEELASLKDEVDYLQDYIKLQKARLDYPEQLRMVVLGKITDQKVPTLMLIEFIENALKHGNIQSKGAFIYIKITLDSGVFEMVCSNSIDNENKKTAVSTGLGMENIRKRLKLLYPAKHRLTVAKKNHEYTVKLRLNDD